MPRPFVRTLVHRVSVGSTSDLARSLLSGADEPPPLPLAVRADRQTRGRGRGTNAWWSDPGSLTVTLGLDPAAHGLRPDHEPRVALATAVALIEAIGAEFLDPAETAALGIRWPNDVEASGRKLAGLLPERVETPRGPRLLIGIGVNVLTRLDEAPPEVRRMATSVSELRAGPPLPRDAIDGVLRAFLESFPPVLARLAADDPSLAGRWAELDQLRGHPVRVDLGPRIVAGLGLGIDAQGALRLETEEGEIRLFGGRVLR